MHSPAPRFQALKLHAESGRDPKEPRGAASAGVHSVFGALLVSGSVRSVQSRGVAQSPPDLLKPLQRAGKRGPTPPDFSVVRVGWGRGEGREVTSLPSLSTPTPVLTCYFLPLHAAEQNFGMGFHLISHLRHPWLH